jgi:ABC-2 type transport system permease protein
VRSQSNAIPESALDSHGFAAAAIPAARLMYWSVRRELWENRWIYVAPIAVSCVFLFGFWISILHVMVRMHGASWLDPAQQGELFRRPYEMAENLIMGVALLVGMFYSIEALYGERRDRSILFWKSLPVSDLTTVLSKASIPIVILPLLAFAITVLTQTVMLLTSSAALLVIGQSVPTLWSRLSMVHTWMMLLFHFFGIHGLWQAPIYGWLMLISV